MKRLGDLVSKLISIKGMFVIVTTTAYFLDKIDYWYVMVAWILFIGSREFYKLMDRKVGN